MELEPRPPWQQLEHERDYEYAWFVRYAEQHGNRSLEQVSAFCGVPLKLVERAAATHGWDTRVKAFDATVKRVSDTIQVNDKEALATQYMIGEAMLKLGIQAFQLKNPSLIKMKDIHALLQSGAEMMRRGAGVADLTIEQRNAQDRIEHTFLELLGGAGSGD